MPESYLVDGRIIYPPAWRAPGQDFRDHFDNFAPIIPQTDWERGMLCLEAQERERAWEQFWIRRAEYIDQRGIEAALFRDRGAGYITLGKHGERIYHWSQIHE